MDPSVGAFCHFSWSQCVDFLGWVWLLITSQMADKDSSSCQSKFLIMFVKVWLVGVFFNWVRLRAELTCDDCKHMDTIKVNSKWWVKFCFLIILAWDYLVGLPGWLHVFNQFSALTAPFFSRILFYRSYFVCFPSACIWLAHFTHFVHSFFLSLDSSLNLFFWGPSHQLVEWTAHNTNMSKLKTNKKWAQRPSNFFPHHRRATRYF